MGWYTVRVYEPAVDPGGYWDDFRVQAADSSEAQKEALLLAHDRWPENKGLSVWGLTKEHSHA